VDRHTAEIAIREVVGQMREFVAASDQTELGEADTKAHFIDPIVRALGWHGIGTVQREYYVKSSQERIDYVGYVSGSRTLAIEAKSIGTSLAEKHAAQLVQYCSVEGIEWAVLTNGRDWHVFNTFLRPDMQAKRILQLDLLPTGTGDPLVRALDGLWLLSRSEFPTQIQSWLDEHRLDTALRRILFDPSSRAVLAAVQELRAGNVTVRPAQVVRWVHAHLALGYEDGGALRSPGLQPASDVATSAPSRSNADDRLDGPKGTTVASAEAINDRSTQNAKRYYGIGLSDLLRAGLLAPGTPLKLAARGEDLATAEVGSVGEIIYRGKAYLSPSDKEFARLLGRVSTNGWTDWYADLPDGRRLLSELRDRFLRSRTHP
jgi:hypothetical protein